MNRKSLFCYLLLFYIILDSSAKTGFARKNDLVQTKQGDKLLFMENKGQVADVKGHARPEVLFTANSKNIQVFLTISSIQYQFSKVGSLNSVINKGSFTNDSGDIVEKNYSTHKIELSLVNANPKAIVKKEDQNLFTANYYLAHCRKGITNVHSFEKITLQEVYPHIDWVIYSSGEYLEYDFIVREGGNPADIKIKINDADKVAVSSQGALVMDTRLGVVTEKPPVSYAEGKFIATSFVQNTDGTIGFAVKDRYTGTLRIDPTVAWSTYYGGSGADYGLSCAVDASGNVYMAGYTSSAGMASGGYSNSNAGNQDAYLVKFNSSGSRLWATYFGGSNSDYGRACAVDTSGNVYVTGSTLSSGLVSGGYKTNYTGYSHDVFLVKFNSSGAHQWSTYYGGTGDDYGFGVATDRSNNVFITGRTGSSDANVINSAGAYQTTSGGNKDAYLVKFNSAGTRQWGTYFGGANDDFAWSCATDTLGNVYLAGQTSSTSAIASTGAYSTTENGGVDPFLAKFSAAGSRVWGTYYGGSGDDYGTAVAVSSLGKVFLAGSANSTSGIATTGTFQTAIVSGQDGFVAQFNMDGTRNWGTYFGGDGDDKGYSCAPDISGNVYFNGISASTNIAFQGVDNVNTNSYNYDAFIVKLSAAGGRTWSSYLGGTDREIEYSDGDCKTSCAADKTGYVYLCGYTQSTDAISSTGAFQAANGGGMDAFLTRLKDLNVSLPVLKTTTLADVVAGVPYTATIQADSGTLPYVFSINFLPPGLSLNSSTGVISGTSTISYSFTTNLKVVDSNGNSASRTITGIPTYKSTTSNFDMNYYTTNWLISDTSAAGFGSAGALGGPASFPNSITNIMSGHVVTINGNMSLKTLNILGTLTNASTNSFTLTVTGHLTGSGLDSNSYITTIMSGATGASYLGSPSAGRLTLRDLTLDDTAGITVIGNVDLNGVVTLSRGVVNTAAGTLNFVSNATTNARLAAVTSGSINGNVTVQRYIPAKRAWRMLTVPLSNTGTIYQNWQNNGSVVANTGALLWRPNGTNGFTSGGASTSIQSYVTSSNGFYSLTNTNSTTLSGTGTSAANKAFSVFVTAPYGSSTSYITAGSAATTLKATGKIQTGNQVFDLGTHPASGFALVGNPYLSAVNFAGLTKTNINNKFWAWDPQRSGTSYGGYVTVSWDAANSVYDVDFTPSSTAQTQYIQSGQAVFVQAVTSSAASVTFHEADKVSTFTNGVFKLTNGTAATIRTVLGRNIANVMTEVDATYAKFGAGYVAATTDDAGKFYNYDENMSLQRNSEYLSIERRPEVTQYDTLFYNLYALKQNEQYNLRFSPDLWSATQHEAWVVDTYLDSIYAISLQTADSYSFATSSAAPLSYDANRFYLVFHALTTAPLSVENISVTAAKQNEAVVVNWFTKNEKDVKDFTVEKSGDGRSFTAISSVAAKNTTPAAYTATDLRPVTGANYYRIKVTGINNITTYSKTVTVNFDVKGYDLHIFPNPVTGDKVQFSYSNVQDGSYNLSLYDMAGKMVCSNHTRLNGSGTYSFQLPQNLPSGKYELRLSNTNGDTKGQHSLIISK